MFSAVAQMIEYPMIIISQSGKISFMTDSFVEIFLLNKAVIPLHVSELFHESTMRMKGADIAAVLEMIVKALQAVTSTSYFFKICNAQYVSETRQLDDLSVVVTMQPMSWHHQRVKKVCSD
jgi:hypothetical protein